MNVDELELTKLLVYGTASVARMEHSGMRGFVAPITPDSVALRPGYAGLTTGQGRCWASGGQKKSTKRKSSN